METSATLSLKGLVCPYSGYEDQVWRMNEEAEYREHLQIEHGWNEEQTSRMANLYVEYRIEYNYGREER